MFKFVSTMQGKKVWMLPQEVIDNTILAYSVSPTTASGYAGASPTGRYFMPANGPDCIEVDNGADYGECASRSLIVLVRCSSSTTSECRSGPESSDESTSSLPPRC